MVEYQSYPIDNLINTIKKWIENDKTNANPKARGILADLRHGLSEATQYRAWPHILKIYNKAFDTSQSKVVWLTIAGGLALLQDNKGDHFGNAGATLREIAKQNKEGLSSFEGRFRRLLSCRTPEDVCAQLPSVFRAAKQKGIPINFSRLYKDLMNWNKPDRQVRIKWAIAYWSEEPDQEKGGLA